MVLKNFLKVLNEKRIVSLYKDKEPIGQFYCDDKGIKRYLHKEVVDCENKKDDIIIYIK